MRKNGFSLVELMIALVIIGIVSAIVLPAITRRSAVQERRLFVSRLNALLQFAWQQSITRKVAHRIEFDFAKRFVTVLYQVQAADGAEAKFQPVTVAFTDTTLPIPDALTIKRFVIEGFDEISRFAGGRTTASWFLINAHGVPQTVSILITYKKDEEAIGTLALELNPLLMQFEERS